MNVRGQTMHSCPPCECAGIHEARGCAGVGCSAGVCGEERAGAGAPHFSWGRDGGGWSLVWKVISPLKAEAEWQAETCPAPSPGGTPNSHLSSQTHCPLKWGMAEAAGTQG